MKKTSKLIGVILFCITAGYSYSQTALSDQSRKDNLPSELVSERTETSKTFEYANGYRKTSISGGAIHYKNQDQKWADINTSIVPSSAASFHLENTTNGIKSYFPLYLQNGQGVKVKSKSGEYTLGHQFSFSLQNKNNDRDTKLSTVDLSSASIQKTANNKVIYDNGNPLGYVEYLVLNNQVKQQFILRSLPSEAYNSSKDYFTMSETLRLPEGWTVRADGKAVKNSTSTQGVLRIFDANGNESSVIPLPEIYEENNPNQALNPDGKMSQSYFVENLGEDTYQISIAIDLNWLTDANRSFPIVIDPNTVAPGGWGGWIDSGTQVVEGNPTNYVFIGALTGTDHLAWVQFDLASIPGSTTVDSVFTSFNVNLALSSSTVTPVEINHVAGQYGPYTNANAGNPAILNDFANGTYTTVDVSGTGNYPNINLGPTATIHLEGALCAGVFQYALTNNNSSYKRLNSGQVSLDVYYTTCTGTPPTVTETFHADVDCVNSTGASTVSGAGTGNISYTWAHNASTSASQTNLAPGTYPVVVEDDANSCKTCYLVTILESAQMTVSTTSTDVACNGDSTGMGVATVTGSPYPITYSWSNGSVNDSLQNVAIGTYYVTATDSIGCTASDSVVISQPTTVLSVSATSTDATCNGISNGSGQAVATGGTGSISYSWDNGTNGSSANNLPVGTHYVSSTDANGCIDSVAVTIGGGYIVTASTSLTTNVDCNGNSTGAAAASLAGGTGSTTYLWSDGTATSSLAGVSAGTYSVTATDGQGCFDTTSITITEPAVLVSTAMVSSNASCYGLSDGETSGSATGGTTPYSYGWDNGIMNASNSNVAAGTYLLTITDDNGCTDTMSATVTEPTALIASSSIVSDVSCNGLSDGEATGSASGGTAPYTYSWDNGSATAANGNIGAGTYLLTATDSLGCSDTMSVTVTEPTAIQLSSTTTDETAGNDGGIDLTVTGGVSPYTFDWDNDGVGDNDDTEDLSGIAGGTYDVIVTDANGCSETVSVTVDSYVGISENAETIALQLYPNPNNGDFTIEFDGYKGETYELLVLNALGQRVITKSINSNKESIELRGIESGVYFVDISNNEKHTVLRFVVQ